VSVGDHEGDFVGIWLGFKQGLWLGDVVGWALGECVGTTDIKNSIQALFSQSIILLFNRQVYKVRVVNDWQNKLSSFIEKATNIERKMLLKMTQSFR
jgi:hypothetical protein